MYVDSHGRITVRFLARNLTARPNTRPLTTAMFEAAQKKLTKDWKLKPIVPGIDGAAVMPGRSVGVISYLKKGVGGWIIGIHCSTH